MRGKKGKMRGLNRFALLAILAFVIVAAIPPFLLLLYYIGGLNLEGFFPGTASFAAVAGLLVAAVFFAGIAFLAGPRKSRRYEWDAVFPEQDEESREILAAAEPRSRRVENKEVAARQVAAPRQPSGFKFIAALAIIAIVILLVASNFSDFRGKLFGNQSNETKISVETPSVKVDVAAKGNATSILSAAKKTFSGAKGKAFGLASKAKHGIQKVPYKAWTIAAGVALLALAVGTLFYSWRSGQLGQVLGWFGGWAVRGKSALYAIWRNKLKSVLALLAFLIVASVAAAFIFMKKLAGPSSSMSSAMDALVYMRNFASAYRLYIFIGILALLVVIGFLFMLEKRSGKGKGNS